MSDWRYLLRRSKSPFPHHYVWRLIGRGAVLLSSALKGAAMTETRKLAAILAADLAGYSKLAGADEERTLARLRALRSDLIDPTIALHHGRVVKRTGGGIRWRDGEP
jgi:class 3 adenylate cyclase